jgi:hypothetical protein
VLGESSPAGRLWCEEGCLRGGWGSVGLPELPFRRGYSFSADIVSLAVARRPHFCNGESLSRFAWGGENGGPCRSVPSVQRFSTCKYPLVLISVGADVYTSPAVRRVTSAISDSRLTRIEL